MPTRAQIEARLLKRVDALAAAARRRIRQWIREGVSLEVILQRITRLPVTAELKKLEDELRLTMEQIYKSEVKGGGAGGQIPFDAIFAKADLFTPRIRADVRRQLRGHVLRAIDEGSGVEGLRKSLDEINFGNTMTVANTSIAGFNNALTIEQARQAQIESFRYDGPTGPTTRPFCAARVGKIFTLDELRAMDNGQGLPVEQYLGGWNCRHFLTAIGGQQ
jgi:hypothetical protein